MRRRLILLLFSLMTVMLLSFPSTGYAETKEIIAEGTYCMGDGETPMVAEERALLDAKRTALEQAGTYVESYSATKNYQLTADEIHVIASGIMEVTVLDKHRVMAGNNIDFWVKIKAVVATDKIEDMRARMKELSTTEDYKKLQEDYEKSQQEVAALKQQLRETSNDTDRQRIRGQIADSETVFSADLWFDRGNRRMADYQYEAAISAYTEAITLNPGFSRAYLKRGQVYTNTGRYQQAIDDFDKAIAINPQLTLAYFGKGIIYDKLGRRHEAIETYRTFIECASPEQWRMIDLAKHRIHRLQQRYFV